MSRSAKSVRSFRFLRPCDSRFKLFFPNINAQYERGEISEHVAEARALQEFGRYVQARAKGTHRLLARSPDFLHDVIVRFEERNLAGKFNPRRGTSPGAYIAGVAGKMLMECARKAVREANGKLHDRTGAYCDPLDEASAREVGMLVGELINDLPDLQRQAVCKKYSNAIVVRDEHEGRRKREQVRRSRGLSILRRRLAEQGIVEF